MSHLPARSPADTTCRLIGSCTDLLPLLQLPADDPRDATPPAAAAAAGNPGSSSSSNSTLLSALQRLDQQARLFQKSAQQLMQDEGDEECTAAVCLALDLSGLVADVADANAMFNATLAAEKGERVVTGGCGVVCEHVTASVGIRRAVARRRVDGEVQSEWADEERQLML